MFVSKERLIPEPCASCGARCCRAGQEFGFGDDIEGARRFIALNEGVLLRRDPNQGIVLRLVEDCQALDGSICTLHGQPGYFGPCSSLEADGVWCKTFGCATCTDFGTNFDPGESIRIINGRSECKGLGGRKNTDRGEGFEVDEGGMRCGFSDPSTEACETIPEEFQRKVPLPGGSYQIIDSRRSYRWMPGPPDSSGQYVLSDSVALDR